MSETPVKAQFEPEFYSDLFYAIEYPALIIDPTFTIRDANQAAVEFLCYESRGQLIGTDVQSILVNTDVLTEVAAHVTLNNQWEGEAKIQTYDNRVFLGTGTAVPVQTPDGEQLIAGLFSDLTKRRQYTRSVKVLNRVLRHNLRNDVNVIIGHLEQLRSVTDEAGHDSIDTIYDTLEGLINHADRARKLETLIRNDGADELSTVDLTEYIERAIAESQRQYEDAIISAPILAEPVSVIADETVTEVFGELIQNAVEHNDTDQPEVRVSLDIAEDVVVVSIADNGPGVNPEIADQLFGRGEIDQLHHGSGMGLFFVDQVMGVYGGEVWLEENDPRGTEVKLQFPRVD